MQWSYWGWYFVDEVRRKGGFLPDLLSPDVLIDLLFLSINLFILSTLVCISSILAWGMEHSLSRAFLLNTLVCSLKVSYFLWWSQYSCSYSWREIGAMETPQHGNWPKSDFGSVSFFFQELSEISQKLKSVVGFPNILCWFPLYLHLIRLGTFPLFFGSVSGFQKKF